MFDKINKREKNQEGKRKIKKQAKTVWYKNTKSTKKEELFILKSSSERLQIKQSLTEFKGCLRCRYKFYQPMGELL